MDLESRGGPGADISPTVHFPFTTEKFSADFFRKKNDSSAKFTDGLF